MTKLALVLAATFALLPVTAAQDEPEPVGVNLLHVTGLTKLNAGVVEIAMEGIAHRFWHCVDCNVTQAAAGKCPTCEQPLMAVEETMLYHVTVDVDAGTIHFDVLPDQMVRLSEIQAALTRFKITIPPEQQVFSHQVTLVVAGPASKEEATQLATALAESKAGDKKLFEKVTGHFVESDKQAEVDLRCAGTPTRPEIEKALAAACEKCQLADIAWAALGAAATHRR